MPTVSSSAALQSQVWNGSVSLEIRLAASDCRTYADSEPYLILLPRLSYLAFLLPRLHRFFLASLINPDVPSHDAWLSFDGVPLKWHYPLGLLHDLLSGAEPTDLDPQRDTKLAADINAAAGTSSGIAPTPWPLTIHYTDFPGDQLIQLDAEGKTMHDMFINSVKEADFVRNGTARAVMLLSREDSDNLWNAVQTHDLPLFNSVNHKLLNPVGLDLRHIPIKVYLPTSARQETVDTIPEESQPGHLRVVQSLISLHTPSKQAQSLGTALNDMLPTIFPSRRNPIFARPVLHGVVVPMSARLEDLCRFAAYTDGFLHIAIVMHG